MKRALDLVFAGAFLVFALIAAAHNDYARAAFLMTFVLLYDRMIDRADGERP